MRAVLVLFSAAMLAASCSNNPAASDAPPVKDGGGGTEGGLLFPDSTTVPDRPASADDWDGDGLSNDDEVKLGTNPRVADTDGDGKADGDEVGPDAAHPKDSDGDGRIDALEPSNFDSDNDGVPDEQDKDEALCNGTPRAFVNVTRAQSLTLVKACSPYRVTGQLWITGGAVLEAEAGVTVQFGAGAVLLVGDNDTTASLELVGTAEEPVVLTSLAASPQKGDWQGIVAEQAASLILAQVNIEYAGAQDPGDTDPRAALLVKHALSIGLTAVSLAHIAGAGLHAGFAKDPPPLFSAFTGCTLTDLDGAAAVLSMRHLGEIGTGNSFASAGTNAVIKVKDGLVSTAATWKALGVPYELEEKTVTVDATLTLEAGVTVIVPADARFDIGYNDSGNLISKGTLAAPNTFQTATPAAGSWQGLVFYSGTNSLYYTKIRGAGAPSSTGKGASIYLDKTALLGAGQVTVSESAGFGAYYLRSGGLPSTGCTYLTGGGYLFSGTFPGDAGHPGCKFLCQDDTQVKCVTP